MAVFLCTNDDLSITNILAKALSVSHVSFN